jgi:hypothetical protein
LVMYCGENPIPAKRAQHAKDSLVTGNPLQQRDDVWYGVVVRPGRAVTNQHGRQCNLSPTVLSVRRGD